MKQKAVLKQQPAEIVKPYEPTPDERAAAKAILARRIKTPRVTVAETNGRTELSLNHPDSTYGTVLLMQMLATSDLDFHAEILMQLGNASGA